MNEEIMSRMLPYVLLIPIVVVFWVMFSFRAREIKEKSRGWNLQDSSSGGIISDKLWKKIYDAIFITSRFRNPAMLEEENFHKWLQLGQFVRVLFIVSVIALITVVPYFALRFWGNFFSL